MHIKYGKKIIWQNRDTYNLHCKLDPILHSALVKFKEVVSKEDTVAGVPGCFLPEDEPSDESFKKALKEWHLTLDKMIYAFSGEYVNIEDYDFSFGEPTFIPDPNGKPWCEYIVGPIRNEDAYNQYKIDCKESVRMQQEGRELFAKFYSNLWW